MKTEDIYPGSEEARGRVRSVFQQARKDLYFPPLDMDFAQISAIQLDFTPPKYKILVNPGIAELFDDTTLKGFFHHELDHWAKHPYDLKTIILEQSWIEEVEENYDKASIIRNLYDDVVVTLDLVINRGLDDITRVYREFSLNSEVDNFLRLFFEEVTGLEFGSRPREKEYLREKLEQMMQIDFLDTRKVRVRKNIVDFAGIISDLIEGIYIEMPFSQFGIEDFTSKEIQKALSDLAKELDIEEFKEIASRTGRWIGITKGESSYQFEKPEIGWYESRAQRYAVYIQPLSRKGSLYPGEIKDFEFDDNIDSYSPENSYGKLLPGIAKRYQFEEFESYAESLHDAVIIIDSSGSMKNPDKEISYAVIGGFAIARNYLEHGSRVGVVNFSGRNLQLDLTRDTRRVYEYLRAYQGSGTTLHLEELHHYLRENKTDDCVLITDMGFDNLEEVVDYFARIKKRLTAIWIKGDVKEDERFKESYESFKRSLPETVTFEEVEKEEELPHIVVGKAFVEVHAQ
ncbi:MAG: hypothetical protein ACLFVX_00430 [Archaeoglobaceae archaeon]